VSLSIDLSNQIALVTGASRGIGAEIARTLARAGANVVLNHPGPVGREVEHETHALATELNALRPDTASVEQADMSLPQEVAAMMQRVTSTLGGLDILVNNAGILRDRSISKMSLEEWNAVMAVNLTGVFHGCKFGLEVLRDGGAIVNMGSLAANACFYGQSNYAAAKAGVHALTRVLAKEAARRGIRVNAVAPGVVDTSMVAGVSEDVRNRMRQSIPLARFATVQEIANAVVFLASSMASYVSGAILEVNGGWAG
jgi:3-oxoacyl-[acyl-carrier protein] reductase